MVIIILDQMTKYLIATFQPYWLMGFLSIHLVKNTGAGWGILQGQTLLLGIISLIVVVLVLWQYPSFSPQRWPQFLWGLFFGGVFGNMIDRLLRQYVIDFLSVSFWPAFNVADAAISVAVICLLILYWKE